MKFSPLGRGGKNSKPTSFHLVIGCREARQYGLSDENGKERDIIALPTSGGMLIVPIINKINTLEYHGFRTEVCTNGKFFFGKLLFISQNITWKATEESKAEASFHAAVDRFLESFEYELPT